MSPLQARRLVGQTDIVERRACRDCNGMINKCGCGNFPKGKSWRDIVLAEQKRLGRTLSLDELLVLAKGYNMTAEEIEAQRQSWARQMMD